MICPQCGQRNELGVERCRACGRPFTRAAARSSTSHRVPRSQRRPVPVPAPPPGREPVWRPDNPDPSYDTRPPYDPQVYHDMSRREPRRRSGGRFGGCFVLLTVTFVALVVLLYLASTWIVQPIVRDATVGDIREGVRTEVRSQIADQIGDAPQGEITVSEVEINERIDQRGSFGPLDDVSVRIQPDGIVVDLSAYGVSGNYRANVRSENGTVVLDGGTIDGPLGYVIPESGLASDVNREIAAALSEAGYSIENIVLGNGEMTLTLLQ